MTHRRRQRAAACLLRAETALLHHIRQQEIRLDSGRFRMPTERVDALRTGIATSWRKKRYERSMSADEELEIALMETDAATLRDRPLRFILVAAKRFGRTWRSR
jgi:hypothetical protein